MKKGKKWYITLGERRKKMKKNISKWGKKGKKPIQPCPYLALFGENCCMHSACHDIHGRLHPNIK
jgi:hypothetical protein